MEEQRKYAVTLTGGPLLMHWDNLFEASNLDKWRKAPENQKHKAAGDDRVPAWTWISYTYNDGKHVGIPYDNLMRCLMEAGALVPVPGGRNGKTFKAQTQSGMMIVEELWPLEIDGKAVPFEPIRALAKEMDFEKHQEATQRLGFSLFLKRARVGAAKHVRVRPRFDRWTASGTVIVTDEKITDDVIASFFSLGGAMKGLGDWRPSSPKSPGPFGRFSAVVKRIK
jgi:hypothetical protein